MGKVQVDIFIVMMGIFLGLVFFGLPISISLGAGVLAGTLYSGISPSLISQIVFNSLNKFSYLAIPMFMLVGNLMEMGGLSSRLIKFSTDLVGNRRGSLGSITVVSSSFFAAISGSANATVAAVGGIMIPEMGKKGYSPAYSGALAATAGTLGVLIPPSVNMIIYAVSAEVSIGEMFLAGVIPGIFIALCLIITSDIVCIKRNYGQDVPNPGSMRASLKKILLSFKDAVWALLAPVIILGGIYMGFVTATESAVVAVIYSACVGFFIYRELTVKRFVKALRKTVLTVGSILLIVSFASGFSTVLTINQIPQKLGLFIIDISGGNVSAILALIILMLVITGMFLDPASQILIYTPLFLPILKDMGVDPIHFGIILIVGTMIGMITPPVGFNLFVGQSIAKCSIIEISKEILLFFCVMLFAFVILVFFPGFSTALI